MPSIEAVEQFKTIVQGLAREPEIRAQMGLPAEEILPPESQVDDDLADLLGSMPTTDDPDTDLPSEQPTEESTGLDDLFGDVLEPEAAGPSLDDLLGPAPEENASPPEPDVFMSEMDAPPEDDEAFPSEPMEDFGSFEEETPAESSVDDPLGDLSGADFGSMDDLLGESPIAEEPFSAIAEPPSRSQAGVSPEDLDDAFFDTPGADLFGSGAAPDALGEDDFEFGDEIGDAGFAELAGFADTKEEDVEAFDAMGEADEFQLGDFESQFGITADDHTDAELLNPAQAIDLDVEAAQKTLSLSDDEFKTIQRALGQFPLNLRLAVEELIGEKEVVFEDLDKVVRLLIAGTSARSMAAVVGKILGRKIVIPAGFEKGSGADLEAKHSTLWYNLRTIMLPVLRVAAVATVVAAVLVILGWNFLLRPWKANDLYERGLVAARQDDGATADQLFAQAWYEWPVQDRFFQYAETYQDTGDYDRARRKYLELLKPSVKPYRDQDKAKLDQLYSKPLAPLPEGLSGQALVDRLGAKKAALDAYYRYVTTLLSAAGVGEISEDEIPGDVVLGNPDNRGILEYSEFETNFGYNGSDPEGHFRRADAVLKTLLDRSPGSKDGLLRKADNFLAWSKSRSSHASLDHANSALSEYLRLYGYDSSVTWRFVKVFLLQDEEAELLKLRDRIENDHKMAMDGETMAHLASWLLDREESVSASERAIPLKQRTLEEEYGIRPRATSEPTQTPVESGSPQGAHSLARSEGGGHGGEGGEGGGEGAKPIPLKPPYKYPYSSQPYRPHYLDKVETLLLRALENQKSLPELHFELSRIYRHDRNFGDEQRALAAADAYFQRLEPRKTRLNGRPEMRVATSNRIGEVFESMGQSAQAEKYYLDSQKVFEAYLSQGLVSFGREASKLYRNLGNLYYRQTPGVEARGLGKVPGGWEQALKLYEMAERGHMDEPEVSYRLGVIEYERREFGNSVKRFFSLDHPGNRGESSGRDNPNLLYAMGNALFRTGNYAAAEGYYRQLLNQLRERRAKITDWDPAGRSAHRALAKRLYETWNNLAAAQYRAANAYRSGTPEFREAIAALTTARAQAQILGRDLYEDKSELDVTRVDSAAIQAIRSDEAKIVSMTRREKGLVEANLQVLSMIEVGSPSRKQALAQQLEIFARIPLELDQAEAP